MVFSRFMQAPTPRHMAAGIGAVTYCSQDKRQDTKQPRGGYWRYIEFLKNACAPCWLDHTRKLCVCHTPAPAENLSCNLSCVQDSGLEDLEVGVKQVHHTVGTGR